MRFIHIVSSLVSQSTFLIFVLIKLKIQFTASHKQELHGSVQTSSLSFSEYEWIGFLVGCVCMNGYEKRVVHFGPAAWRLNIAKSMWQWDPRAATNSLSLAVWPWMCVSLWMCLHGPPCLCVDKKEGSGAHMRQLMSTAHQGRDSSDCHTPTSTGLCALHVTAITINVNCWTVPFEGC